MFHFQHTEYLVGLAAIPILLVLYFFVLSWKKKATKKIGDERLVKEISKNYSSQRYALKFLLIILAFTTTVIALANLRTPKGTAKVTKSGIDVIIALDVSKSMLAQDIKPTRLDRAKQVVAKLIDKLKNDRIGIIIFAGKAYLQMPLTGDHNAAKMYLSSISTDAVPTQGTVVADALKMSSGVFNTKEKKYKSVVLISDGEDHDEEALKITEQMVKEGIVVNTIGIGSPEGATITDEVTNEVKKDNEGNVVITKLNEKELIAIAEKGKGIYQLFTNADKVVNELSTQLDSMDQRSITEDSLINYKNYFPYFLLGALIFLIIDLFISERKKVAYNLYVKRTLNLFFIFSGILTPLTGVTQNNKSIIKKGNEAYNKKEYQKAIVNYQKAIEKDKINSTAHYNLGNALYKNKRTDEAISAFDNAITNSLSKNDKAKSYYNKGVVLQNNKKLPECIDAYKNALKLNPQDEDARQNLQKALLQQKQEQQKKDNKNKQKPKEDQQDQKQKENQKSKDDEQKNEQSKPQPSKMSKQDAEEKLKALMQQDKNLQEKLNKINSASSHKPEKDW